MEANPASGNQEEEFIRIHNNENTEIDISDWTLEGGVRFTFRAGTVIERNGDLYVTPSSKDFINRAISPTGGEELLTASPYSGHLSNFSEILTLKNEDGVVVDTINTPNKPSDTQLYLVVSEIMYHPASPNGDAEYVELMNISETTTLELGGVKFTEGIDFAFPAGTKLAPGTRILVILDETAFEAVHGPGKPIAGIFQNGSRLNNGSDRMKLEDASNSSIQEFTYDDELPWPTGPDGGGFSLVLIEPTNSPDHDLSANWKQGSFVGGTPGEPEPSGFTGDPNADPDRDGLSNLLEYAFGTSPTQSQPSPFEVSVIGTSVQITIPINLAASDLTINLQSSKDLSVWIDASGDLPEVSRIDNGDGTASLTFLSDSEYLTSENKLFFRLKVELN
jgi:hypothetical protein